MTNLKWAIERKWNDMVLIYERIRYGYCRSDIWSLSVTIAKFVLPRLQEFKQTHIGYPTDLKPKQWDRELDRMILAFQLLLQQEDTFIFDRKSTRDIERGLAVFAKYYQHLWD